MGRSLAVPKHQADDIQQLPCQQRQLDVEHERMGVGQQICCNRRSLHHCECGRDGGSVARVMDSLVHKAMIRYNVRFGIAHTVEPGLVQAQTKKEKLHNNVWDIKHAVIRILVATCSETRHALSFVHGFLLQLGSPPYPCIVRLEPSPSKLLYSLYTLCCPSSSSFSLTLYFLSFSLFSFPSLVPHCRCR